LAIKLRFKVGSQDDPPGKEGLASLTASLLSEGGSETLPYDRLLEKLFPLAASIDASVDKEMTVFSGVVHKDNVDAFLALFTDTLLHPGFRKEDFDRLHDLTISGIAKVLPYSSDEELGKATLTARVFDGTPYGHLVDGTVAGLKSITLDDVKAFYRGHFTRENVVLGLGGAYADSLPQRLGAELGSLPSARPAAAPAP